MAKATLAALVLSLLFSATLAQQPLWGQCGGIGYTGPTTCASGATCVKSSDYYSQCLSGSATTSVINPSAVPSNTPTTGCFQAANGFASLNGGTTGGSGGTVVTVTTQADLAQYAAAAGKYVIKVQGRITISPKGTEIKVASDKTIIGVGTTGEINQGGFNLKGVSNVIIRNLKIGNTYVPEDYEGKTQDWDGIQMDGSSNIWIDHCLLEKGGDGLVDSRVDTTFLTLSYSIFRDHNKAFGIGWTTNLTSEITIHHNWFHNTNQRNPSADNIKHAHLYNNYLYNVTSYGHYARGSTAMRMENVWFEKVRNPVTKDTTASLQASGNTFVGCTGTQAANSGSVFNPSSFYTYSLDNTASVPDIVKAQAGPQANICT